MKKRIGKWLKIALCLAGLAALLVLSGILGTRIERDRQQALELQKEQVSVVAVVNMDDGVPVENEHINYASKLMSFPNDHFTATGLSDAKAGIENGTYAAYIVIPETFSASVTSIENDPQKVKLVYQYNSRLTEDAQIQAVNDINAFVVLLNSNIAYMYMDAIMAEFHRIQDDSTAIMANDNTELERLANVNAAQLIAVAEPVEEISVDNDIRPIELTAYAARNDTLLDHLLLNYSEAVRKGKDDYLIIRRDNAEVETAADRFLLAYDTAIHDTIAEQSQFLATGRDELAETVGVYNRDVDAQETELRNIIANILNMQLEADRDSAETQLQNIVEDIRENNNNALKKLREQWKKAYQDLQKEWEKTYQDSQERWEKTYQESQEQWEKENRDLQEHWEKNYQESQEQWEKENQDLQEQWEKTYQESQEQWEKAYQDIQIQWGSVYQDLQAAAEEDLAQKVELCYEDLGELVKGVYIQGYNNALDELDGQIDTLKEDADPESIAVSVLRDTIAGNRLGDPLPSETETYIEDLKVVVNDKLSGIAIDWSQLDIKFPEIPGSGSESGGEDPGGEDPGGEEPGGEDPGGEDPGGEDPGGEEPGGEDPGGEEPGGEDPGGEEPGGEDPEGEEPGGEDPGGEDPGGEDPGGEDPGGEEPGGEDPGGEEPGGEEPGGEDPGVELPGGEEPDEEDPGDPEEEYEITLTVFSDEETIDNAVRETLALFKLEPESEQINSVIQTYFVDALSQEGKRQMGRLSDAKQAISQNMEEYETRLLSYDPMQYIENADLSTYINDIETNAGEMFNTVEQNNYEYVSYASEMYASAAEHTNRVRNSLNEANTQTVDNIKECMDDLILSRVAVNSQNVDMLEGFTNSLRYTRVGSQGNAEVYDYIVNPVTSQTSGQAAAAAVKPVVKEEKSIKVWLVIVLGVAILLCLAEVILSLRKQYKKPQEESEDTF